MAFSTPNFETSCISCNETPSSKHPLNLQWIQCICNDTIIHKFSTISYPFNFSKVSYKYRKYSPLPLNKLFTLLDKCLDVLFCTPSSSSPFLSFLTAIVVLFTRPTEVASAKENLHLVFEKKVLFHDSFVPFAVLVRILSILKGVPEIIIFVQTFSHLPPARLINISYFEACLSFHYSNRYLFDLWKFNYDLFDKVFIGLSDDLCLLLQLLLSFFVLKRLNEWFGRNYLHKFVREISNFIGLDVLLNHSCEFYDLISILLLLVLNLPSNL